MIADELDEFLDAFTAYFPDVSVWLDKQNDETVKAWRKSLESLNYQAALDALAGFHRGDFKPPPTWSLWPAAIGQQSKRAAVSTVRQFRVIDGETVYSCLACRDTGMVLCWHAQAMRAMSNKLRGKEGEPHFGQRGTMYTASVRCYCEAGSQRYQSYKPIYSDREWVKCDGIKDAASIERLERFVAAKLEIKNHPGYTDFGEYSGN